MVTTVRDIIRGAYRKIGVYSAGESLGDAEAADGLEVLIDMIDSWSNSALLIPVVTLISKVLTLGERTYTIGHYPDPVPVPLPSNHIEVMRPQEYLSLYLVDSANTSYPLKKIGAQSYDLISTKDVGRRPIQYYIRGGWPLDTIIFDSQPDTEYIFYIQARLPLSDFLVTATLDDVVDVPPGYMKALKANLAIEMADEFGQSPSQLLVANALSSLKRIKARNYQPLYSRCDRALVAQQGPTGTYLIDQGP